MPDPVVWPIAANGAEDVKETYGFLTDVITSNDEREQRISLRVVPLESIEFSILAEDAESGLAESLLYATHDEVVAVPLWHYGSRLTAPVSIGASLLPIADALDVPYARSIDNPGLALVWRSYSTWELFTVSGTSGSGVATSDTAASDWAVGDYVFPVRLGKLPTSPEVVWLSSRVLVGRLPFSFEQT